MRTFACARVNASADFNLDAMRLEEVDSAEGIFNERRDGLPQVMFMITEIYYTYRTDRGATSIETRHERATNVLYSNIEATSACATG